MRLGAIHFDGGFDSAFVRGASVVARLWRDKLARRGVTVATAPKALGAKAGLLDSFFIISTFFDYLYALNIQSSTDILIIFLRPAPLGNPGRASAQSLRGRTPEGQNLRICAVPWRFCCSSCFFDFHHGTATWIGVVHVRKYFGILYITNAESFTFKGGVPDAWKLSGVDQCPKADESLIICECIRINCSLKTQRE